MPSSHLWAVILAGMALTYLTRLSFIALFPSERMPDLLRQGLKYVLPAALAAIILPEVLGGLDRISFSYENPRLLAAIVAALVAWKTGNTWLTTGAGMVALWLLTYFS